jgi:adenylosuccinate synthase
MRLNSPVDAIALTMLDHLAQIGSFQVCLSYEYCGHDFLNLDNFFEFTTRSGRIKITGIKPTATGRTDVLSRLLFDCIPWEWNRFEGRLDPVNDFIRFLESPDGLGMPVRIASTGPGVSDKKEQEVAGNLRGG